MASVSVLFVVGDRVCVRISCALFLGCLFGERAGSADQRGAAQLAGLAFVFGRVTVPLSRCQRRKPIWVRRGVGVVLYDANKTPPK